VVVIAVRRGQFLIPVQRYIGGVDVEDEFAWRPRLRCNERLDQYPVQGHEIGTARVARVSSRESVGLLARAVT
jgi:hypothetical protein